MARVISFKRSSVLAILVLAIVVSALTGPDAEAKLGTLSKEQRDLRLDHARELLGSRYKKSVVRTGEKVSKVNGAIYRWTRASLPKKFHKRADVIAQAIIDESHRHGFDPIFVLSVIQTESSFNPDQIGGVGEIGLMQIRPKTGQWIAKLAGLPWKGPASLKDPVSNIRIGVTFMAHLREKFDSHARLYIAAYNMGPSNVNELRSQAKWPKIYPAKVMSRYVDFYSEIKQEREQDREEKSVAKGVLVTSNP